MKISKNLKDFYNQEAMFIERYSSNNFWENRYHNKRRVILQEIIKNNFVDSKTFLDVGCGSGEYLRFAKKFAHQVYGLDLSKHYLIRCKSTNPNFLMLSDSKNIPFQKSTIDFVLCSEVIEHIKEQNPAINEILLISRKSVLISTPTHGLLRRLMSLFGPKKLAIIDAKVGHVSILKFNNFLNKIVGKGWRIKLAYTVHIFPPTLDELHFPKRTEPIVCVVENLLNRLLPSMGTLSIFYLEAE